MTNQESIKYVVSFMTVSPWVGSFLYEEILPRYEVAIVFNVFLMVVLMVATLFHIAACLVEPNYKDKEFILTKGKKQ